MDKFSNKILAFIRTHVLTEEGDTVLCAFSGGADSMAMLLVLNGLSALLKLRLVAVHVNHGLREGEAERDETFCKEAAERLGIPFHAVLVDVKARVSRTGESTEEAARILRYEAFSKLQAAYAKETGGRVKIAVAHHADDQAETILLNLLRGSGLRGISGMPPKRDGIIRPMLCTDRREILRWLDTKDAPYVTDSTNLCDDYTRNFLRNRVLPMFSEEVNSRAAEHILAAGLICGEADAYLSEEAKRFIREEVVFEDRTASISHGFLKEKPQIFRRYVIIETLKILGAPLKDFGERQLSDLDKALFSGKGFHLDLPNGVTAENAYKRTLIRVCQNRGA